MIDKSKTRAAPGDLSSRLSVALSRLERIDWYSRVGQRVDEADKLCVEAYLATLGYTGCKVEFVYDLDAVKTCTKVNFDSNWFEFEERLRGRLMKSLDTSNLEAINRALRTVIDPMSERVMQAAQSNLSNDELQVLKVAAGSAIEACYQYALQIAVSAKPAGVFGSKITIFEQGRWPLTVFKERFYIY